MYPLKVFRRLLHNSGESFDSYLEKAFCIVRKHWIIHHIPIFRRNLDVMVVPRKTFAAGVLVVFCAVAMMATCAATFNRDGYEEPLEGLTNHRGKGHRRLSLRYEPEDADEYLTNIRQQSVESFVPNEDGNIPGLYTNSGRAKNNDKRGVFRYG
ncbi:hypothetical protein HELRODRAFT_184178 [Helobdella robusta]|uniref:Uncharacterized protein n=1 Tax=Helobdella robusta TaxID=6412 RepID=T1FKQ3_HELRO|nr:hypothetical protein HELRODRAFT_184178 [Helobdella robusta]ESO06740.1 hypothetical protein HELRODRAFT_184178 [Helobdella robusta]